MKYYHIKRENLWLLRFLSPVSSSSRVYFRESASCDSCFYINRKWIESRQQQVCPGYRGQFSWNMFHFTDRGAQHWLRSGLDI